MITKKAPGKISSKLRARFIEFRPDRYRYRAGEVNAASLIGESIGARNLSGGITTLAPGTSVQAHSHNTEEVLIVLKGKALIEADGKRFEAEPFDACYLPSGVFHRVTNSGDSELRLLWMYGSTRPVRILGYEGTIKVQNR